jgi:UV DNA damage endonuclease
MRLGFPDRVYGLPAAGAASLGAQLARLRDVLCYLDSRQIRMYRLSTRLVDALAEEWPDGIAIHRGEIDLLATACAAQGLRLSFHPHSAVALGALHEDQVHRSVGTLVVMAGLLDALALPAESVIVLHAGGVYGDATAARERFVRRYEALPPTVRRRLTLENDDRVYSLGAVRRIHDACGIPLVFDNLHHRVHDPDGLPMREALALALGTWPAGVTAKVHFCSARTEVRGLGTASRLVLPRWTEHADLANPFEFAEFLGAAEGLPAFDVMLEAKARDLALLKLREDLARFAPEIGKRFG